MCIRDSRDAFQRIIQRFYFFIVYHGANRQRIRFFIVPQSIGKLTIDGFHFAVFNLKDFISCPIGEAMRIVSFNSPLYAVLTALRIYINHTYVDDAVPVSYTHLDVYKRQYDDWDMKRAAEIIKNNRRCPCVSTPITRAHRPGLVQQ